MTRDRTSRTTLLAIALLGTAGRIVANPSTADSLPHWDKKWSEEFSVPGVPDPAVWGYEIGAVRNNELQYYTDRPANATVVDGNLRIRLRKETFQTKQWTSASVITQGKKSFLFGRIEVRAKLPVGTGTWPAIWTLGTTGGWPAGGEIDIMEFDKIQWPMDPGMTHPYQIAGTAHWTDATTKHDARSMVFFTVDPTAAFHTYSIEWDSASISWFFDDTLYHTVSTTPTSMDEFRKSQYLLLNLALDQNGGAPGADTIDYLVDYVRHYQPKAGAARHRPPVAAFLPYSNSYVGDTSTFRNTVDADGLSGKPLSFRWELPKGAGKVWFESPTDTVTRVTFSAPGDYVLWFSASDGLYSNRSALFHQVGIERPVATPSPAAFQDSIDVTLSSAVPGAVIHYSTDGSQPNQSSKAYSAPVRLKATTTLNFIAIEPGLPASRAISATYTRSATGIGFRAAPKPPAPVLVRSRDKTISVQAPSATGNFSVKVARLDGTVLATGTGKDGIWHSRDLPRGILFVTVEGPGVVPTRRTVVR